MSRKKPWFYEAVVSDRETADTCATPPARLLRRQPRARRWPCWRPTYRWWSTAGTASPARPSTSRCPASSRPAPADQRAPGRRCGGHGRLREQRARGRPAARLRADHQLRDGGGRAMNREASARPERLGEPGRDRRGHRRGTDRAGRPPAGRVVRLPAGERQRVAVRFQRPGRGAAGLGRDPRAASAPSPGRWAGPSRLPAADPRWRGTVAQRRSWTSCRATPASRPRRRGHRRGRLGRPTGRRRRLEDLATTSMVVGHLCEGVDATQVAFVVGGATPGGRPPPRPC